MTFKHIKISLISIFHLLLLLSCENDFLDTTGNDLTGNDIFKDASLTEMFIKGLYVDPFGFSRGFHLEPWFSSFSDETFIRHDRETFNYLEGRMSPTISPFHYIWNDSFRSIRQTNFAIEKLKSDDAKGILDEKERKKLIAEVRFIRAFRYFHLMRCFGKIPLLEDKVTQLKDTDFSKFYDRKSIEQVSNYIISELDALMIDIPSGEKASKHRANKVAAMLLKARTYLYVASPLFSGNPNGNESKWKKAAETAKTIMDMGGTYGLVSDKSDDKTENYRLYFVSKEATKEDIFIRFYSVSGTKTSLEITNGPNGSGGWGGNTPIQNFVDDYEMKDGKPAPSFDAIIDGKVFYKETQVTIPKGSLFNPENPYQNRDPRLNATVVVNGAKVRTKSGKDEEDENGKKINRVYEPWLSKDGKNGGKDSGKGNENWNSSLTGYIPRKFIQEDIHISSQEAGTTPWRYMRYAEVLLIYAEAKNETEGPTTEVYSALNQIRARAGMPNIEKGLNKEQMREKIRQERRIELAFEGHRFFDVRRWKIAMQTENKPFIKMDIRKDGEKFNYRKEVLKERVFEEKHYWLPIPLSDITTSKGELEQNSGY